jgi:hypothetical protein
MNSGLSISQVVALTRKLVESFYTGPDMDRWHDMEHGERVLTFAKRINAAARGDRLLIEVGALLHQFHKPHLEKLEPVLTQLPLRPVQINELRLMVKLCRPEKITSASPLAAKVVRDADYLDLLGPSGILREIGCNLIARGMPLEAAAKATQEVQRLFEAELCTEAAKKIAAPTQQAARRFWECFDISTTQDALTPAGVLQSLVDHLQTQGVTTRQAAENARRDFASLWSASESRHSESAVIAADLFWKEWERWEAAMQLV